MLHLCLSLAGDTWYELNVSCIMPALLDVLLAMAPVLWKNCHETWLACSNSDDYMVIPHTLGQESESFIHPEGLQMLSQEGCVSFSTQREQWWLSTKKSWQQTDWKIWWWHCKSGWSALPLVLTLFHPFVYLNLFTAVEFIWYIPHLLPFLYSTLYMVRRRVHFLSVLNDYSIINR